MEIETANVGAMTGGVWGTVAITLAFASLARWLRGVTVWGAIAGTVICFLLLRGGGLGAFVALVTVFALTLVTTRLGYRRKQDLGIAEQRQGRRASQVVANLGIAAICAGINAVVGGRTTFLVAAAAALAEAAGDTVSSEVGQVASDKARLITNWQEVAAGTDGAITLAGSAAGVSAALLISLVCGFTGMLPLQAVVPSFGGAVVGMAADSLFGAWLQPKRLLNNDAVNFLSTLIAASASATILVFR